MLQEAASQSSMLEAYLIRVVLRRQNSAQVVNVENSFSLDAATGQRRLRPM